MEHNCKNYQAHGGNQWVIGGKLTFLPGATVEGGEGLFDAVGTTAALPNIPASTATTVAALRDDFNALLEALEAAGIMASATADDSNDNPLTDPENQ